MNLLRIRALKRQLDTMHCAEFLRTVVLYITTDIALALAMTLTATLAQTTLLFLLENAEADIYFYICKKKKHSK